MVAVCLVGPSLESASYLALVFIFSQRLGELVQLTNFSAGQGGKLLIFLSKLNHFFIWRLESPYQHFRLGVDNVGGGKVRRNRIKSHS